MSFRRSSAPFLALLLLLCGLGAGCSSGGDRTRASSPTVASNPTAERTAAIYAAVVRRLFTRDSSFGDSSVFKRVFVVDGSVAGAGEPKPFSAEVKTRIARRLGDLPPLDFVNDADSVIEKDKGCGVVKDDGVLITLGPVSRVKSANVKVRGQLFVACLGASGATYVLRPKGKRWNVVGTSNTWMA